MDIRWVCCQRRFATRYDHRLDFIKQDDGGNVIIDNRRDMFRQEIGDPPLTLTVFGTHQAVRIYLDQAGLLLRRQWRQLLSEATREGCFAGTGRPIEERKSMQSCCFEEQAAPKLETERRRSEQSVLDRLFYDDGIPEMLIISVGHEAVCYDDVGYIHFAKSLCTKEKLLCNRKLCKYNFPVKSRAKASKKKPAPDLQADTRNTVPAIGAVLRRAREHNELSLREVERRTGRSSAYLSQVERGLIRQPDPVVLLELAEMYRLDFLTLARWAGWASDAESPHDSANSATYLVRQILELDDEQRAHLMSYIQELTRKART